MATYSMNHPEKGEISYTDKKRYLWFMSITFPLMPLMSIYWFSQTGIEALLAIPLAINYILLPILDWAIGADNSNPPEELVPQLEEDRYYRILTYLTVPMHFIVLLAFAWVVGTFDLSILSLVVVALVAGSYSGIGINTAHELGHKNTKIEKWLAKIVLAVPAYGHFSVEHNLGHYFLVATPEDPASSRLGESLYAFAVREISGTFVRGWQLEKDRLTKSGLSFWSRHNDILQSYAISILLQGSLVAYFGWIMVPFLLMHNFWAWSQLTLANYIEHYGLLRAKKENGKYV